MDRFDRILDAELGSRPMTLYCVANSGSCRGRFAYLTVFAASYCTSFWNQKGVKGIVDFCHGTSDYVFRGGTSLRVLAGVFFDADDPYPLACDKAIALDNGQKIRTARNYEVGIQIPSGLPRARR